MITKARAWGKKSLAEGRFRELRKIIRSLSYSICLYVLEKSVLA
jgi:hypothetical protein